MRNGDYTPNRLEAQYDAGGYYAAASWLYELMSSKYNAASIIVGRKMNDHPESTVGLLTMGGAGYAAVRHGAFATLNR